MRAKWLGGVVLALIVGTAPAQQPVKPPSKTSATPSTETKKSALELALEEALKNNPDLKVTAAKAAEADANLSRARLDVVRKVVTAYQAIEEMKAKLEETERRVAHLTKLRAMVKGAVTEDDYHAAQAYRAEYKAKLAAAEAELDYLIGKAKNRDMKLTVERDPVRDVLFRKENLPLTKGPGADRLRKALEKKATLKFEGVSAKEALEALRKACSDIHIQASEKGEEWNEN